LLTEGSEARVRRAYKAAVPAISWYVEAAKGQLELFAKLGIKASLKRSELLQASDNAIKTILANNRASHEQRIEALYLNGRNATMKWRRAFEDLSNLDEWRKAAVNRNLIEACNSYLEAYFSNLNHYESGLAALQMCAIAKSLADQEIWEDAFDDEKEAKDKKEQLLQAFDQLKHPVELAVKAARKSLPKGTDDRIWAEIANAKRLLDRREGNAGRSRL
jgi:hypothetical protein